MIRISEMVLPGHPDKFCDQVADAAIAACVEVDADAYGQVEVAVWSDQVWLSGGICTRRPLAKSMRDIVVETGLALGYTPGNHIDATRYQVTSTVCDRIGAYAAREAALRAVRSGASECLVRLAYAPNQPEPLDVCYDMIGRGKREGTAFFHHGALAERYDPRAITRELAQGGHFFDANASWNRQAGSLL